VVSDHLALDLEQDDDGQALQRLARRIAPLVRPWADFLAAVDWSRDGGANS